MSFNYILKEGLAGFQRARLASLTSIFSLFIAVLLLGVLARVSYNAYVIGESLKQAIDVEVFLMDLDQRTINELENKLSEHDLVQEVGYISKDSAATIFKKEFGAGGNSLAELKFLPASFRLQFHEEAEIEEVNAAVGKIQEYRGVDEVRYNQQLLQLLESRFQTVATAGGGLGVLVLLAALILVFNTIRLTIYAKRGLIKAMKLVGATNAFIRRPFVLEGVIQGFIGGILAIVLLAVSFEYVLPQYISQVGVLEWPYGRWYYLCGSMLLLSVLMGFLGSQWAAHRFIKKTAISE